MTDLRARSRGFAWQNESGPRRASREISGGVPSAGRAAALALKGELVVCSNGGLGRTAVERTITQFTPGELLAATARIRELDRTVPKATGEPVEAWLDRAAQETERSRLYWAARVHGYLRQLSKIPGREVDLARVVRIRVMGTGAHDATFDIVLVPRPPR